MSTQKCCCDCGCLSEKNTVQSELTLADLPIGMTATVVGMTPAMRGRKKFTDIGLVPGTELMMEAHAPFGGLLRVKVMESSMALHRDDAENIVLSVEQK